MKLDSIKEINPTPSQCITVDGDRSLFAVGTGETKILTHNSVAQQNIIFGTILRPEHWRFIGIDLKRVELSRFREYSNVVLGIATEVDTALACLRFGQKTMMDRYAAMEQLGVNKFLDLPQRGQALMIMVDELAELLEETGTKALAGNTIIPTPDGPRLLADLKIGDTIYNNYCRPTIIKDKYSPKKQKHYMMRFFNETTGAREVLESGAEHLWVVYMNDATKPHIFSTKILYKIFKEQSKLSPSERSTIRVKRFGSFEKM